MRTHPLLACALACALLALSACSPSPSDHSGRARERAIDIGTVHAAGQDFPARGLLFPAAGPRPSKGEDPASGSPASAEGAPILIVSHLRSPNCEDGSFALECPQGVKEIRYDEGMAYLGEALSEEGFTVLIPDLGAVLSGGELTSPYDQVEAWTSVVGALLEEIPGDHSRIGLLAHSRSAAFADSAVGEFGADAILTYGGFYDETSSAPRTGQTPVLALVPELDSDVGFASMEYVAEYPASGRFTALTLPGFGHMLVNRKAPDERVGCDELECADAETHEEALVEAADAWFGRHLLGDSGVRFDAPEGARILSSGGRFVGPESFTGGQVCRIPAPMSPEAPENPCPDAESGAVLAFPEVDLFAVEASASVEIPDGIVDPRLVLAPLAPAAFPIRVDLLAEDGRRYSASIEPSTPAILMGDEVASGAYFPSEVALAEADRDASPILVTDSSAPVIPAGTRIVSISIDAPRGVLLRGVVGH